MVKAQNFCSVNRFVWFWVDVIYLGFDILTLTSQATSKITIRVYLKWKKKGFGLGKQEMRGLLLLYYEPAMSPSTSPISLMTLSLTFLIYQIMQQTIQFERSPCVFTFYGLKINSLVKKFSQAWNVFMRVYPGRLGLQHEHCFILTLPDTQSIIFFGLLLKSIS